MLLKLIKRKSLFYPLNKTKNQLTLVKMLQNGNRQSSKAFVSKVQIPVKRKSIQDSIQKTEPLCSSELKSHWGNVLYLYNI